MDNSRMHTAHYIWSWLPVLTSYFVLLYGICEMWYELCWRRPMKLQRALEAQGVRGKPYRLFSGDIPEFAALLKYARSHSMELSHDIVARVLPHYAAWSEIYGPQFMHWYGTMPRLTVLDPELAREILCDQSGRFEKAPRRPDTQDFLDKGLFSIKGDAWAFHRRILTPAFRSQHLKAKVAIILESTQIMLERWQRLVMGSESCSYELEVSRELRELAADAIGEATFGCGYFLEGKRILELQIEQQKFISEADHTVYIPGSRFLPTRKNRRKWALQSQIRESLLAIIQNRLSSVSNVCGGEREFGNDLLGTMLAANHQELPGRGENQCFTIDELIGECSSFFLAGHESTSNLLTWTFMLLAHHWEWQERARAEVLAAFGKQSPTIEGLQKLKIVAMVLNESLRLYPPVASVLRFAWEDAKLGNLQVPKGMGVVVPILAIHHSTRFWGKDANEFKPERFDGAAIRPTVFMPFSTGPRVCVGQKFAMMEAKAVIAGVLQRFAFRLSPSYRHAPSNLLTLQPQHGVQIILRNYEGCTEPDCVDTDEP